ncbi:MAG: DUF362 domain-containing protein [Actinobacteria bacterium]|nr:DUF362 domain-containing protein [Actinomycetota bacterium]
MNDSNHHDQVSQRSQEAMTRRQFLLGLSALGLVLVVPSGLSVLLTGDGPAAPATSESGVLYRAMRPKPEPLVAIARGTNNAEGITAGVRRAVDLLGGIGSVVKPGDRVLIKPNIVRDYSGETGITTDIRLVREVVRLVLEAGGRPFIGEACGSLQSRWYPGFTGELFKSRGFTGLAREFGIKLVDFDIDNVILTRVEGGRAYSKPFPLPQSALRADKIIALPKIKGHAEVVYTGSLKLNFGYAPAMYRRVNHLGGIYQPVLDITTALYPDLVIADGVVAGEGRMAGNEPSNVKPVELGVIIAGRDPVAVDAVVEAVVGLSPGTVPLTPLAVERGLGTADLSKIIVKGEPIAGVRRRLEMPRRWLTDLANFGVEEMFKPQLLTARVRDGFQDGLLAKGVKVMQP